MQIALVPLGAWVMLRWQGALVLAVLLAFWRALLPAVRAASLPVTTALRAA
ncbi:hypothetical protein ACG02S_23050 [Roseateles sp. DC23W]|uniref:Uncharacterized protein n=1 Tax=Pelomonas dachongensis TaxID=3299029 RepID=A0ABW7ETL2_9BURK